MLFIVMEKLELPGGHIEIMLFIEIELYNSLAAILKLTGGHIELCYL